MKSHIIQAQTWLTLPAELIGRVAVFDPDSSCTVLLLEEKISDPVNGYTYRLWIGSENSAELWATIPDVPFVVHHVQLLSDDQVLLVHARCRYRYGDPEHNARIYQIDGSLVSSFTLGDGIAHISADKVGGIWVGYFDEGIFGSRGWNQPLGSSGLVKWTTQGQVVYEFEYPGYSIADCYAMNLQGSHLWLCPYTDFPILNIFGERSRMIGTSPVRGSSCFAVEGRDFLFSAGYDDRANQLKLVHSGKNGLLTAATFCLNDEIDASIAVTHTASVGDALFLLHGRQISRITVHQAREFAFSRLP